MVSAEVINFLPPTFRRTIPRNEGPSSNEAESSSSNSLVSFNSFTLASGWLPCAMLVTGHQHMGSVVEWTQPNMESAGFEMASEPAQHASPSASEHNVTPRAQQSGSSSSQAVGMAPPQEECFTGIVTRLFGTAAHKRSKRGTRGTGTSKEELAARARRPAERWIKRPVQFSGTTMVVPQWQICELCGRSRHQQLFLHSEAHVPHK